MKARKNLLKILIFLILSGSIINGGYIKKNTIHFTNETVNPQIKEIVRNVDFKTFKIFEENDVEKINSKHHFLYYNLEFSPVKENILFFCCYSLNK